MTGVQSTCDCVQSMCAWCSPCVIGVQSMCDWCTVHVQSRLPAGLLSEVKVHLFFLNFWFCESCDYAPQLKCLTALPMLLPSHWWCQCSTRYSHPHLWHLFHASTFSQTRSSHPLFTDSLALKWSNNSSATFFPSSVHNPCLSITHLAIKTLQNVLIFATRSR